MSHPLTPEVHFAGLVQALRGTPGVTEPQGSRTFGASALKSGGKIFAMLAQGRLVVKLPRRRVDELIAAGMGERFDPGHGRVMKEWLSVDPDAGLDWLTLAEEARKYVDSGS